MGKFKGTNGEWSVYTPDHIGSTNVKFGKEEWDGFIELWHHITNKKESIFNAQLIADAGNVRQQISFDLPELLRQRDELLKMVSTLVNNSDIPNEIYDQAKKLIESCKHEH